jgi:hypothetical protein
LLVVGVAFVSNFDVKYLCKEKKNYEEKLGGIKKMKKIHAFKPPFLIIKFCEPTTKFFVNDYYLHSVFIIYIFQ